MTDKIPESQSEPELPMVVYLRGDEDLVEEFHLDAEEAMEMLGIKRSRLTQISGRDLRVGRIRRDRYIRPVYRLKDLEDYQSWTRSTASHQSSSILIEKVIDRVEQQCRQLEDAATGPYRKNLEDAVSHLKQDLHKLGGRLQAELQEQQRWHKHKWAQQPDLWFRLQEPFRSLEQGIATLKQLIHKDFGHLQEVQAAIYKDLLELMSLHKRLVSKWDEGSQSLRSDILQAFQQQQERITADLEQQTHLAKLRAAELEERLLAQLQAKVETKPARGLPKRRIPQEQRRRHLQVFGGRRA
ncbi:MAG: hypothetical protein ACOH5I_19630 [Oligoflexus sp.]